MLCCSNSFSVLNKLLPKLNSDEIDFNFNQRLRNDFTSVAAGFLTRIGFKKLVPSLILIYLSCSYQQALKRRRVLSLYCSQHQVSIV
jgi:hypothetical protein